MAELNTIKLTRSAGMTPRELRFLLSNPDLRESREVIGMILNPRCDGAAASEVFLRRVDHLRRKIMEVEHCV